jgi:hypothetical protein
MIGECSDCGRTARLHFIPDPPSGSSSRPEVCQECKARRERQLQERIEHELGPGYSDP